MINLDFKDRIKLYLRTNPELSYNQLGTLFFIDNLYNESPKDIDNFRRLYTHLDPKVIDNSSEGIMFLKIAQSDEPKSILKKRLNNYINIKYNYLGSWKTYEENMARFRENSSMITQMIDDILISARMPIEIINILREHEDVRGCKDFYDMLVLYKKTASRRIKYEILRKIGLIVLLARINKSYLVSDVDFAMKSVGEVFRKGLGLRPKDKKVIYLWIDENGKVAFSDDKKIAFVEYEAASSRRAAMALETHPLQTFGYTPFDTRFGNEILHIEIRNKMMDHDNKLSYTSFVEKIIRKNLEFPNQVHDVIGVKIIVKNEAEILRLISNLSTFLGGTSTRKKEKNTLHQFGRKKLSDYSSKDYFVWKSVYDIALPHPSLPKVKALLKVLKPGGNAKKEVSRILSYFNERPRDFVVELQLQQLDSYLLSIAKGSHTDHAILKMNQILFNSFYKFFPNEIYEDELFQLRKKILGTEML